MNPRSRTTVLFLLLAGVVELAPLAASSALAATTYVYPTFKGDGAADQELWIYTSTNGTAFSVHADTSYRGPTGVLRDPSIIKHSDGRYYIAYTVQSWTTQSTHFNIASSSDLISWTHVASVPAGVSGTFYTWAPEFFVEGGTVRLIVSLGTGNFQFTPHVYTAQNGALTSWSGPASAGIGSNYIDMFVVKSGSTYHAFVKNETTKFIEHFTSTSLTGGWTNRGTLWSAGHEGPSVAQMDSGAWRIYVDRYPSGGIWTATSSDLNSWTGLSSVGCSGCRHGTALRDTAFPGQAVRYRVTARHSGKCLDVQNPNTSDGARVGQYACSGQPWQSWDFRDAGGGFLNLVSRHSGKCLDVSGASTADGAQIIQWSCNGGTNQQWQWTPTGSYHQLRARHSGKCADVVGASMADGALVKQYPCGTQTNQQWTRIQE
jgi:Ricin-type beta-trefoil lectin domain/Glycosyl hydrolases family 43